MIKFSWTFDWDARNLIECLCHLDPNERLGVTDGNLDPSGNAVREHRFLRSIDFWKLERRQLRVPHVPKIESNTDTTNFLYVDSDSDEEDVEGTQPFLATGALITKYASEPAFADW